MNYNCYPVDYINITQPYSSTHQAIDLGWWGDTSDRPIYSVNSGTIIALENNYNTTDTSGSSYGNYVRILHDDNTESMYAHLKYHSVLFNVGDRVGFHEQIATMGNTGPHLHFELRRSGGVKLDPFAYLYRYPEQELRSGPYSSLVQDVPYVSYSKKLRFNFVLFNKNKRSRKK